MINTEFSDRIGLMAFLKVIDGPSMKSLQSSMKSMFMAARDLKQRLITTLDSLGIDPSADEFPVEELQTKIKAGLQENLSLAKMNMAAKAREIWDRTVRFQGDQQPCEQGLLL